MAWLSDDEIVADIVSQTAEFRYRICWAGARRLLADRGLDPMQCLQLSCDQGGDVNGTLVLPDGTLINFDMREDPRTRELVSVNKWEVVSWDDREVELARGVVLGPDSLSFDERVRDHFESHWRHRDEPLPPSAETKGHAF